MLQQSVPSEPAPELPELSTLYCKADTFQMRRSRQVGDIELTLKTPDLSIYTVVVTPYYENTRIVRCEKSGKTVVIDPGGESDRILELIQRERMDVEQIWLTHSHPDHCGACADLKQEVGAEIYGHPHVIERLYRRSVRLISALYGVDDGTQKNCPFLDRHIVDGDVVKIGDLSFSALGTPGHSPGHLCYYNNAEGILFTGDLLFRHRLTEQGAERFSYAPTSVIGARRSTLLETVKRLHTLPPDTLALPGHVDDFSLKLSAENLPDPYAR
jgi:hydroxyacylglutathione hydrolase